MSKKWEYLVEPLLVGDQYDLAERFDVLGLGGWDLVGVSKAYAFFKKPVVTTDDPAEDAETLTASISSFDNFEEVIEKAIKFIERVSRVAKVFIPTEDE